MLFRYIYSTLLFVPLSFIAIPLQGAKQWRFFNPTFLLQARTIATDDFFGALHIRKPKYKKPAITRKKIIKWSTIAVPNPEGYFDTYPFKQIDYISPYNNRSKAKSSRLSNFSLKTDKKLFESLYLEETLKELVRKKNPTILQRCAGVPQAEENLKQRFKKSCGKPIEKAKAEDLKQFIAELESNESLTSCSKTFVQQLQKTGYYQAFKQCVQGKKSGCEQAKADLSDVGTALYWKNSSVDITKILLSSMVAGHPKNFKNTQEEL